MQSLGASLRVAGHRQLVMLCGEAAWGQELAAAWCQSCGEPCLWLGAASEQLPAQCRVLSRARPVQVIGLETAQAVMDLRQGFDADLFAALSGTISGGGLLLLLAPSLQDLRQNCSPCAGAGPSLFMAHFLDQLHRHPGVVILSQHAAVPQTAAAPAKSLARNTEIVMTRDQEQAVAALLRTARGHRRRPLVLISDRGRGKSSALGIAAATLLQEGRGPLLLTAPRRDAVTQVYAHCRRLLGSDEGLQFAAPDALLDSLPPAAMVLVDEAAALPAPLLQRIVDACPRVAFATTVHGYEGTGRGFQVRFQDYLQQHYPGARQVQLRTPIRWNDNDPLEAFVFDALLLNAQYSPPPRDFCIDELCIEVYHDRRELLARPERLRELFALLVTAHYRTRPRDLCYLLDDPDLSVLTAVQGEQVVGVCLLLREAPVPAHLAPEVLRGRRRLRGKLIAQTLLAQLAAAQAGDRTFGRIMRIAVHPRLRHRGIARLLLDRASVTAQEQGCDYLGSSYAATEDLPAFWQRLGLQLVYLGLTRDHASGCHSALVLKSLCAENEPLIARLQQDYRQLFHSWLRQGLAGLSVNMVLGCARYLGGRPFCGAEDGVHLYIDSRRGYESCMPAVDRFVFAVLHLPAWDTLDAASRCLLVRRIVQGRSQAEAARDAGLSGRRDMARHLRRAVEALLKACSEDA